MVFLFSFQLIIFISSSYSKVFKILTPFEYAILLVRGWSSIWVLYHRSHSLSSYCAVGPPLFFDIEMVRNHYGWSDAAYNFA